MITVRYFAPSEYRNLTIHCNSCLKGFYGCICYILLVIVCIDEHDIDSIDRSVSVVTYVRCRCQETTRLWQRFWICDNLAYDLEPDDMEVRTNRLCCTV
jgi:hypothetical protein